MIQFKDSQEILNGTNLVEYFLELVKIDSQSCDESETSPSSPGQLEALEVVADRLKKLGLSDAEIDENGYLFATLESNCNSRRCIGLLAHIDTATDFSGHDVKPVLHSNFDGKDIRLNDEVIITVESTPELALCKGDTVITSDGTTLLGADDKAGVAEILAALEYMQKHPEIRRPRIRVGITPDEEIGRGASKFDIARFNADCAYTLDGGWLGEINSETFSADGASIKFTGVAVHPGFAKNRMVNALKYAAKFIEKLPADERPENTEGRQGFYHMTDLSGNASEATLSMILRDFEVDKLKVRGETVKRIAKELMDEEPRLKVSVEITETYRNMAYWLKDRPEITEKLLEAVEACGITPQVLPIRGGTDGSGLTAKGLPTPNIFAGGLNFHGPREWISTRVMAFAVCTVLNLVQGWAE